MENLAQFYITEEQLLNHVGFNKETSVVTGVEFNPQEGSITISVRSSDEVKGVTAKGAYPRRKRFLQEDRNKKVYNITINTHGCETTPIELAEEIINELKKSDVKM